MSAIDNVWLSRVIAQVQELSLAVVTAEQIELPELIRHFTAEVDAPPDHLHDALLANILIDVCRHTFESLHASLSCDRCSCAAESWAAVMRCARWYEADPRTSVCAWIDLFVPAYQRNHPPTASTRAAEWMRHQPARKWRAADMARRLGVTRKTLGRDFRQRFGLGPVEYLHAARIAMAIAEMNESWKIEAIACHVGYRSKKDLYREFKRWTGLTPAGVRALPSESRRMVEASMRARCLWGEYHAVTRLSGFAGSAFNRVAIAEPGRRAG
jgi:AraC-like DNA-binding protein